MRNVAYILILIIGGLIGWYLKPCHADTVEVVRIETDTIIERDTVVKFDTIQVAHYKPYEVRIIDSIPYLDSNYYHLTFTDTNYTINTYGGFVDSLHADIYRKDSIITIETTINNRIERTIYEDLNKLYLGGSMNYSKATMLFPTVGLSYASKNVLVGLQGGYLPVQNAGFVGIEFKYNLIKKKNEKIKVYK